MVRRGFLGCAFDDHYMWLYHIDTNSIIKADIQTGVVHDISVSVNSNYGDAFSGAVKYGKELIFAPFNENCILVFNTESNVLKRIPVDFPDGICVKYVEAIECDNKVVLLPALARKLTVFDVNTQDVSYNGSMFDLSDQSAEFASSLLSKKEDGTVMFLTSLKTNSKIIEYNVHNNSFKSIVLENNQFGKAIDGAIHDAFLYILFREPSVIVKYDANSYRELERIVLPRESKAFSRLFYCGEYLLLTAWSSRSSLLYEIESENFYDILLGNKSVEEKKPAGYYQQTNGDIVISFLSDPDNFGVWEMKKREMIVRPFVYGTDAIKKVLANKNMLHERPSGMELKTYLDTICEN